MMSEETDAFFVVLLSTAHKKRSPRLMKGCTTSMAPDAVGQRVIHAIEANELYIFTHPDTQHWLDRRHAAITAAFDQARHLAQGKPT